MNTNDQPTLDEQIANLVAAAREDGEMPRQLTNGDVRAILASLRRLKAIDEKEPRDGL